jgi:hypothetical protein
MVDRGIGTQQDSHVPDSQLEKASKCFFDEGSQIGIRDRAMFFMALACVLRGNNIRDADLCDLFSLELPDEGYQISDCQGLGFNR